VTRPASHTVLLLALGVPLAAVIAIAAAICISWNRASIVDHAFERLGEDATEQIVVAKIGEPDTVSTCPDSIWWGADPDYRRKNDGRCVKWARYEFFLIAYGIGYSTDGRVVSKYRYASE
jgi:hypothetical protein